MFSNKCHSVRCNTHHYILSLHPLIVQKYVYNRQLFDFLCFKNQLLKKYFYQNRFINEFARKIKTKIPESRSLRVSQSQSYL